MASRLAERAAIPADRLPTADRVRRPPTWHAARAMLAVAMLPSAASTSVVASVTVIAPVTPITLPLAMLATFMLPACFPIAPIPVPTPVVVAFTIPAGCHHNLLPRHVDRTRRNIHGRRCDVDRARYADVDIEVNRVSDASRAQQRQSSRRNKIRELVHHIQQ